MKRSLSHLIAITLAMVLIVGGLSVALTAPANINTNINMSGVWTNVENPTWHVIISQNKNEIVVACNFFGGNLRNIPVVWHGKGTARDGKLSYDVVYTVCPPEWETKAKHELFVQDNGNTLSGFNFDSKKKKTDLKFVRKVITPPPFTPPMVTIPGSADVNLKVGNVDINVHANPVVKPEPVVTPQPVIAPPPASMDNKVKDNTIAVPIAPPTPVLPPSKPGTIVTPLPATPPPPPVIVPAIPYTPGPSGALVALDPTKNMSGVWTNPENPTWNVVISQEVNSIVLTCNFYGGANKEIPVVWHGRGKAIDGKLNYDVTYTVCPAGWETKAKHELDVRMNGNELVGSNIDSKGKKTPLHFVRKVIAPAQVMPK